jgi:putative tricarboxylic transport membrane protein
MALMLGALVIHGLQPGPLIMKEQPALFWGTIASMYIGNLMLLLLNIPFIGIWVQILKVRYTILFPFIILFCLIGVFGVNYSRLDIWIMLLFGVFGYVMRKLEYEMAPLVLALILGPMFESALRQSLIIFNGNPLVFFTRPISAAFLLGALLLLLSNLLPWMRSRKKYLADGD